MWQFCRARPRHGHGASPAADKRAHRCGRRQGREHGHFQRDLQLVGRQHLGHRIYTWRAGARSSAPTTSATATTCRSKGVGPLGVPRRWVIYKNLAEASKVPPDWHGWLHYTVDTPPTEENYQPRPWQQPHRMNMTGTPRGLSPAGLDPGARRAAQGDRRLQALAAAMKRDACTLAPRFAPHFGASSTAQAQACAAGIRHGARCNAARCMTGRLADAALRLASALARAALALLLPRRAHAERIENAVAVFAALDKVTATHLQARGAAQPDRARSARSR